MAQAVPVQAPAYAAPMSASTTYATPFAAPVTASPTYAAPQQSIVIG